MEDDEIDPEIAAAMGFSSFGGTKKRKYDNRQSPKPKPDASGANATEIGVRAKKVAGAEGTGAGVSHTGFLSTLEPNNGRDASTASALETSSTQDQAPSNQVPSPEEAETLCFGGPPISRAELNALRLGVKDSNGDMAYFLPNFVEDPWEKTSDRQ